jgi:uncharacterized coiled-coil protein SlyX
LQLADRFYDDVDYETPEEPRRGRWMVRIAVVAGLATLGVGSAFLWRAYSDSGSIYSLLPIGSEKGPVAEAADKAVMQRDFLAFQQQIAGTLQSTSQLLAGQQAEMKRLSDQVSALTAKIDALQRPPASAQAAIPAPPPAAPPPARKKPAAPKPAAGISTGGAPLPTSAPLPR